MKLKLNPSGRTEPLSVHCALSISLILIICLHGCACLGNPMDSGAWQAAVHGVAESDRIATEYAYVMLTSLDYEIPEGGSFVVVIS